MTNLQNRNNSTSTGIDQLSAQIEAMQEQLTLMTHELRTLRQRKEAQDELSTEWQNQLRGLSKLLKDACSVYGEPEALDDMLRDVVATVESIKEDFGDYASSDRFVNQETAESEDIEDEIPLLLEEDKQLLLIDSQKVSQRKAIEFLKGLDNTLLPIVRRLLNIPDDCTNQKAIASYLSLNFLAHELEEARKQAEDVLGKALAGV